MGKEKLNFSIIYGLKAGENFPEELKKEVENFIASKANKISEKVHEKIDKYFESRGDQVLGNTKREFRISGGTEPFEVDDMLKGSESLDHLPDDIREKILSFKAKTMELRKQTNMDSETEERLSELTGQIVKAKSEEEKSNLAFELLQLRIEHKQKGFEKDLEGILNTANGGNQIEEVLDNMSLPPEKRKVALYLKEVRDGLITSVKDTGEEVGKLQLLSYDEFIKCDLDSKYKYIKDTGDKINQIEKALAEKLEAGRDKLVSQLVVNDFTDRFLLAALGK